MTSMTRTALTVDQELELWAQAENEALVESIGVIVFAINYWNRLGDEIMYRELYFVGKSYDESDDYPMWETVCTDPHCTICHPKTIREQCIEDIIAALS